MGSVDCSLCGSFQTQAVHTLRQTPYSSYAQDMLLMLVPVGTPGSYISLLLGRAASVSTSDILLSLSLGAHLIVILSRRLLSGPSTEGYSSALDNGIYIVSTKLIAHRDTCLCGL